MARGEEYAASLLEEYHGRRVYTPDCETPPFDEKLYLLGPVTNSGCIWRALVDYLVLISSLLRITLFSLLHSFVPSFLHRSDPAAKTNLHPTAYLDGIRGVAALFVFIYHFLSDWFPSLRYGYCSSPEYCNVLQLPMVRIFYQGRGMVTTFFIISGYVLSYKALRQIRSAQFSALLDTLASSTFRRGMRIFIPTVFTTFISLLIARKDWYRQDPLGRNLVIQKIGDQFYPQFLDWWYTMLRMSNPFGNVDIRALFVQPYGSQLWTIPVEYRGSLVIFLTLLCLSKVTNKVRITILAGFVCYTTWMLHWDLALFLMGTLFADLGFAFAARAGRFINANTHQPDILDYISKLMESTTSLPYYNSARLSQLISITTKLTFLLGIYLLCYPDEQAAQTPGYITLVQYTPKQYTDSGMGDKYWLAIGASLVVGSTLCSATLQKPFNTPFAQYLARISYALYLVHPLFLHSIGMKLLYGVLEAPADFVPSEEGETWVPSQWKYGVVALQAAVVCGVGAVWFADWVWRCVDAKAVAFARWFGEWVWVRE